MQAEGSGEDASTVQLVPATQSRGALRAVSSVERGRGPTPGVYVRPYHWEDVLATRPPRRHARGEGGYVVYHRMDLDWDTRITYTTVVSVDPGEDLDRSFDDEVSVDSRVGVQKRALLEFMDRNRAFTTHFTDRARERLMRSLVAQRSLANGLRVPWLIALAVLMIRAQARLGLSLIRGSRRVLHGVAEFPDAVVTRLMRVQSNVGGRFGRRALMEGLKDPARLSNEQKSVVLFLSSVVLFGLVFLFNSFFALVLPQYAGVYRHAFADATLSLFGTLFLPIAVEPLLILSTLQVGAVIAFTGLFAGKILGVWLLYFFGDSLYAAVEAKTRTRPRLKRAVAWTHENADRYGFWLLIVINAFPFMTDLLLYPFALAGMRFRPYLGGIALGTAIKYGGVLAAMFLLGPERVAAFLENPFG